jgi:hypothetical protein
VGNWRIGDRLTPVAVKLTMSPPKAVDIAIDMLYGRRPAGYMPLPMRGGVRRFLVRFPPGGRPAGPRRNDPSR